MVDMDPAFENVGQTEGLECWRIENKEVVPVQSKFVGKVYEGDSYIFLKTYKKNENSTALSWNLHFWLGKDTSQDESGIAAYKSVELDESLGGGPVQYRECQNHESNLFLSYFKSTGLEYLPGGVDSGFNHVERDSYSTRLLHLKGKRTVRVNEVECKNSSLNNGDVFILDNGLKLFLFNGENANRSEKVKGVQVVNRIKDDERGGRAEIIFVEEGGEEAEPFWEILGGKLSTLPESTAEEDEEMDVLSRSATKLFKLSDSSGTMEMSLVNEPNSKLTKDMLNSDDVFILDISSEIFVWIGKGASLEERRNGMKYGMNYLKENNRPLTVSVTRVVENGETPVFKSAFHQWSPPKQMFFGGSTSAVSSELSKEDEEQQLAGELSGLMESQREHSEESVCDEEEGNGCLKVWRIENMEKVEVPESQHGIFYEGDSYILLYTYRPKGSKKDSHIIYFWQGRASSLDEKGSSAILAAALDEEMGGSPVQVRVTQGKEPLHFKGLFKGNMMIQKGGVKSGFNNTDETTDEDFDSSNHLFHVKGTSRTNICCSEVDCYSRNLNSGDCFIAVSSDTVFIWKGEGASNDEVKVSQSIAEKHFGSNKQIINLSEEQEQEEFWAIFTEGKEEYPKSNLGELIPQEPRLFEVTNSKFGSKISISEIQDFSQDDLNVDDVYLLDTYTSLYIWVGTGANEFEKRKSTEVARMYLSKACDATGGRDQDCPIITVPAGEEPLMFTCNFLSWDAGHLKRVSFTDPYEAKKQKLLEEKEKKRAEMFKDEPVVTEPKPTMNTPPPPPPSSSSSGSSQYYAYEDLRDNKVNIEPHRKEEYLSDEDFKVVFSMTRDEFNSMALWKRKQAKKDAGLF